MYTDFAVKRKGKSLQRKYQVGDNLSQILNLYTNFLCSSLKETKSIKFLNKIYKILNQ